MKHGLVENAARPIGALNSKKREGKGKSINKKEKNIIHIGEISEASATCIERAYKTHPERKAETQRKQRQSNRTVVEDRTGASVQSASSHR